MDCIARARSRGLLTVVAIVLGVAPELEAALYFTVVVLLLVIAAWTGGCARDSGCPRGW